MGFDIKTITDCFALSKKQIRDLLITIILPVAAGVAFIAPLWPSLIKDARTLNICLLGFVVALPVVLLNNIVWSLLSVALIQKVITIVATSFLLSSPGLRKNEFLRGRMRSCWNAIFDDVPFFDDMRSEVLSSFYFRDIASVHTTIAFYTTAVAICLFKPATFISALLFLFIALLLLLCAVAIIKKISSELQSTLSKMTHREIMDHVGQFAVLHFSADLVKQMQSFLYGLLDGDPNTPLSVILEERMIAVDHVLLKGEYEIHKGNSEGTPVTEGG